MTTQAPFLTQGRCQGRVVQGGGQLIHQIREREARQVGLMRAGQDEQALKIGWFACDQDD